MQLLGLDDVIESDDDISATREIVWSSTGIRGE